MVCVRIPRVWCNQDTNQGLYSYYRSLGLGPGLHQTLALGSSHGSARPSGLWWLEPRVWCNLNPNCGLYSLIKCHLLDEPCQAVSLIKGGIGCCHRYRASFVGLSTFEEKCFAFNYKCSHVYPCSFYSEIPFTGISLLRHVKKGISLIFFKDLIEACKHGDINQKKSF